MANKPTYEELEQSVADLEKEAHERKRSDERLRLLSLAVEQSSEGIAIVDLDGNLEYLNDAFAKMHGYTPEELVDKHLSVFHTPQQMPSVEATNRKLKETGDFKGEIWHVTRNGTEFPTLMHNSLIRDATNKPIGMMRTVRDISDIKQAQEALRESEEKFRKIFETVPSSIVLIDKDGQIVDINPYHLLTSGADGYFNVKGAPILKDDEVIGAVATHAVLDNLTGGIS